MWGLASSGLTTSPRKLPPWQQRIDQRDTETGLHETDGRERNVDLSEHESGTSWARAA